MHIAITAFVRYREKTLYLTISYTCRKILDETIVASSCRLNTDCAGFLLFGDNINRSAKGIRTINTCHRPLKQFHTNDIGQFNRNIKVIMPGLWIGNVHSVQQHQHLIERTATNTNIRLCTAHTTLTDINTRHRFKQLIYTLHGHSLNRFPLHNCHHTACTCVYLVPTGINIHFRQSNRQRIGCRLTKHILDTK